MKFFSRITVASALLFLPVGGSSIHALTPEFAAASVQDDAAYAAGSKAMDEHRWQDAVVSFDKVISAKGKRVDAAVYWKAYSLNKLGKPQLAAATCDQLHAQDPNSHWNRDCSALTVNVHIDTQALAESMKNLNVHVRAIADPSVEDVEMWDNTNPPHGSDEDLKMLALNSLLNQDPARAIPLLRGVLTGNGSPAMKKHALFVLAQSKSPDADVILHDAAMGKMGPDLQREAIRSIAVFEGKRSNDTLVEVYKTTSDPKIKKSVISGLFITQDAPRMVELARNEKDLELKRSIVSQLALMNDKAATDYMMELLSKP